MVGWGQKVEVTVWAVDVLARFVQPTTHGVSC